MRAWVMCAVVLVGCEPTTPAGGLFEPTPVQAPAAIMVAPPTGVTPAEQDGFDFDADAREDEEMGLVEAVDEPVEPAEPEVVEAPEPEVAAAAALPAWDGSALGGSWGVRVISTTPSAQPPVAVLGFGTGEDRAVRPGDLIEEHRLVVMAIGRDAVQVARIVPEGDHARVETEILPIMTAPGLSLSLE